jgi:hypothetical protein
MDNAIKNENRLTKMEERLKNIEDKVDKLPDLIMERFEAKVMLIKQEAIREAMLEDEKVFVKRSDVEFLEKIVCDVVSKQVGKWFITKVVVSTAVIVAVIQYIISLYK